MGSKLLMPVPKGVKEDVCCGKDAVDATKLPTAAAAGGLPTSAVHGSWWGAATPAPPGHGASEL
jgi:hypothetical protein